jgi:ferric-dicitrate binding protein FerR (iron transport regulator)
MNVLGTERLIHEVLDGTADAGMREELERLLQEDEGVRELYCSCCAMDSALQRLCAGQAGVGAGTVVLAEDGRMKEARTSLLAAVAAVVVLGGFLWMFVVPAKRPMVRFVSGPEAIYSVVHAAGSGAEGLELEAGSRVVLRQGSMGLDFRTGVRAVLEAPAEVWIRGEERVELVGGIVWFEVPTGQEGFEVLSPELRVEDLGTEFGVVVEEGRLDEVHVTKGSVRVWHRAGDPEAAGMLVNGRQGLRSTPQRDLEHVPFDGGRFATKVPARLGEWTWTFDGDGTGGWAVAGVGGEEALGVAVPRGGGGGPVAVDGVVGGALRFEPGTQLETGLTGVLGSRPRTIAGWVRIPKDVSDEEIPTSFVFWGIEGDELSRMKWRVGLNPERLGEGGVKGALRTEFGLGWVIGTTDLRDGRWHHVASVFQGGNTADNTARVLLYVDGVLEGVSSARHQRVETMPRTTVRMGGFGGRFDLDELGLTAGAISAEQIAAMAAMRQQ